MTLFDSGNWSTNVDIVFRCCVLKQSRLCISSRLLDVLPHLFCKFLAHSHVYMNWQHLLFLVLHQNQTYCPLIKPICFLSFPYSEFKCRAAFWAFLELSVRPWRGRGTDQLKFHLSATCQTGASQFVVFFSFFSAACGGKCSVSPPITLDYLHLTWKNIAS